MKKSKLRDIDHGWMNIKKKLVQMRGKSVAIGVLESAAAYPDGTTQAEVAFYNEYGTSKGIPERPFIRTTADENADKYAKRMKKEVTAIFEQKSTVERSLERVGLLAQGHVRKKIKAIKSPPNTSKTIKAKGSSNPLIDTSAMLKSIDYEVRG